MGSFETHPDDPIDQCWDCIEAQDYQRAISAGEQAVRLYPNSHSAYLCLEKAYFFGGKLSQSP